MSLAVDAAGTTANLRDEPITAAQEAAAQFLAQWPDANAGVRQALPEAIQAVESAARLGREYRKRFALWTTERDRIRGSGAFMPDEFGTMERDLNHSQAQWKDALSHAWTIVREIRDTVRRL